jgi:hypothetical protein
MNIGKALKNVGSQATAPAVEKATNVANGANRAMSAPTTTMRPSPKAPPRRVLHKGSAAGLRNEKTARLELQGAGYSNPSNQKARYQKKAMTLPSVSTNTFSNRGTLTGRDFDHRPLKSSCGSIKILRKNMQ